MIKRLLIGVIALSLSTFGATVFFGEDLGQGEGIRLPAHPNSDAARALFLASLSGVGTEEFEGFANGPGSPLGLSFPGSVGAITATLSGGGSIINSFNPYSGAARRKPSLTSEGSVDAARPSCYQESGHQRCRQAADTKNRWARVSSQCRRRNVRS